MNVTVMQANFYFAVLIRTVHTLFLCRSRVDPPVVSLCGARDLSPISCSSAQHLLRIDADRPHCATPDRRLTAPDRA
jgi:hypothetical protein